MKYRENERDSENTKRLYLDGLEKLISDRQRDAMSQRDAYVRDIFTDSERYREEFKKMLGWPLVGHKSEGIPKVNSERLSKEDGYTVYRMSFEILEGLFMTGLYFETDGEGKRPLVLTQHGGMGTPEVISGVYGDTTNYNGMLERVVKNGVHAFAPQLLLWDRERYEPTYERWEIDARLKRVGSSITALEVFGLTRILDYFETRENVSSFGMVGLSYGGFYTLFTTAIDTRIKSALSCSFFNTRDKYPWCDWTWFDSASRFDDAEIACLVYPRKLCIEIGTKDELFDVEYGKKSFERLKALCKDVGTDWVKLITFDGTHEFCKNDEPIEALVKDIF